LPGATKARFKAYLTAHQKASFFMVLLAEKMYFPSGKNGWIKGVIKGSWQFSVMTMI
jgi:hypothetical protein